MSKSERAPSAESLAARVRLLIERVTMSALPEELSIEVEALGHQLGEELAVLEPVVPTQPALVLTAPLQPRQGWGESASQQAFVVCTLR